MDNGDNDDDDSLSCASTQPAVDGHDMDLSEEMYYLMRDEYPLAPARDLAQLQTTLHQQQPTWSSWEDIHG